MWARIEGNQYTFEGNNFMRATFQANAVEESLEQGIVNQEMGRSHLEFYNQLSRAKGIQVNGLLCGI